MIDITVVIPTYNRAAKLCRAIRSVTNQIDDTCVTQIVVVDDGSQDGTQEALRDLISGRIIKYIRHNYNRGVCAAKNTGIKQADGDVVILLDSDDELIPGTLSYIRTFFRTHSDVDILFGRTVDDTGRSLGKLESVKRLNFDEMIRAGELGEYLPIVRRTVLLDNPFEEDLRGFESYTWMKIAYDGAVIYYSDIAMRKYDATGPDRLCATKNILANAEHLGLGYMRYLDTFGESIRVINPRYYNDIVTKIRFYCKISGNRGLLLRSQSYRFVYASNYLYNTAATTMMHLLPPSVLKYFYQEYRKLNY